MKSIRCIWAQNQKNASYIYFDVRHEKNLDWKAVHQTFTQTKQEEAVKKILLLILLVGMVTLGFCQSEGSFTPSSSISAYTYDGIRSGVEKLKMNTYILGQVGKPGLYVVPDDTDFLTLISLAGGPREDAKLSKIRIVRPSAEGDKIIWVNFKKYLETGDPSLIPEMKPGDTVVLSGTIFYAFSRVADFLSKAAIALSVYNLVINIK